MVFSCPNFRRPIFRQPPASSQFLAKGEHDFLLRHGTPQAAQRTFHFAQVADFFAQFHISHRNNSIAICNLCQEQDLERFQRVTARRKNQACTEERGTTRETSQPARITAC